MAPKARAGGAKPDVAMAEKENISDGADYRLTQEFGASVALIARSGRLPITREEKIYPTFSTPPTSIFSRPADHNYRIVFAAFPEKESDALRDRPPRGATSFDYALAGDLVAPCVARSDKQVDHRSPIFL